MTKKDYINFAESFRITRNNYKMLADWPQFERMWIDLRANISEDLKRDNPSFDREKFYAACTGEVK